MGNAIRNAIMYSTPVSQIITIRYNDKLEEKITINGTGKIELNGNCKLTTLNMILATTRYTLHTHTPARV